MPTHQFSHPEPQILSAYVTDIPGILCYHPQQKIVIAFEGDGPGPHPAPGFGGPILVRDLDMSPHRIEREIAEKATSVGRGFGRITVIVVSGRWEIDRCGLDVGRIHRSVFGIDGRSPVISGTPGIHRGAHLTAPDGETLCVLGDPADGPMGRHLARIGEVIAPDEAGMLTRFAAGPFDDLRAAGKIQRSVETEGRRIDSAETCAGARLDRRRRWIRDWEQLIDELVDDDGSVTELLGDEANLRTVARTLCDHTVRDMTFWAVADADRAEAMRTVWMHAARCFTGSYRANALAAYALDREAHGCTGLAVAALNEARVEHPEHSLTMILGDAIAAGAGAQAVRMMVRASLEVVDATWTRD